MKPATVAPLPRPKLPATRRSAIEEARCSAETRVRLRTWFAVFAPPNPAPPRAELRGESREFLTQWEPVWAQDELTRGAFRRRIKRYQKETRLDSAYVFFVFRKRDDTLMGGCTLSNVRRGV